MWLRPSPELLGVSRQLGDVILEPLEQLYRVKPRIIQSATRAPAPALAPRVSKPWAMQAPAVPKTPIETERRENAEHARQAVAAAQAWKNGDRADADRLARHARSHLSRARKVQAQAAAATLLRNNASRGRLEIDLHGLYVREALSCLDARLAQLRGQTRFLYVITGRGARLGTAIETYCWSRGLRWHIDPGNPGALQIELPRTYNP